MIILIPLYNMPWGFRGHELQNLDYSSCNKMVKQHFKRRKKFKTLCFFYFSDTHKISDCYFSICLYKAFTLIT